MAYEAMERPFKGVFGWEGLNTELSDMDEAAAWNMSHGVLRLSLIFIFFVFLWTDLWSVTFQHVVL